MPGSSPDSSRRSAGLEGFVIALSNPKIAFFFAALFSQFIEPDATAFEKILIASTAAGIDTLWYALVSILLAQTAVLSRTAAPCDLVESVIWRDTHRAGGECGDDIIHAQWTGYWPSLTAASAQEPLATIRK